MNNLSDLTVEELLDVKGGSADTPIINRPSRKLRLHCCAAREKRLITTRFNLK